MAITTGSTAPSTIDQQPPQEAEGNLSQAQDEPIPLESPLWNYLVGLACRMTVLFGFYTLSIGPMYWNWYSGKFVNGSKVVAAFYEPLWLLGRAFPWFGEWLDYYVKLWVNWMA